MVLYINCAIHAPGVKFGHAPGVDSLHRLTMGKKLKIFFSETTGPTALIFGMWQWLMVLYSPLDDPGKNKIRCTPRGTKVAIYHIVGIFMLNSMHYVVSLATCAESL